MENLMKQIRLVTTYFSPGRNVEEEENKTDLGGSRDQKIPTQKSPSFKEKKRALNWFQRQFSRKMSHDYDTIEMEHATAVAASVFAISQELSEIPRERKKVREPPPQTTLSRIKSKVNETRPPISQPGGSSKLFSGSLKRTADDEDNKDDTEKTMTPAPSMKRTSTFSDKSKSSDEKKPEIIQAPKKTPSFRDKHSMNNDAIKPAENETPKPEVAPPIVPQTVHERGTSSAQLRPPPIIRPPPPPLPPPMWQASTRETKADVWERNELEKIKERYEKLLETIESWERRKKMKARRKLNKEEQSENERKRMKSMRKYQEKIKYIDEIAGGARAQAEERRRNEVLRAKEKANVIRTTGKLPGSCSCF